MTDWNKLVIEILINKYKNEIIEDFKIFELSITLNDKNYIISAQIRKNKDGYEILAPCAIKSFIIDLRDQER